jgi:hypothetical protein
LERQHGQACERFEFYHLLCKMEGCAAVQRCG